MKSDVTNPSWKPTLTLAKLFEEQNQFYDALAIYEIIGQTDQSPDIRQKIETLQSRILNDPNLRYDPRIEKLFSPEELAYLKILNHSAFENLARIQAQFVEGGSDYETEIEDELPEERTTVSSFELRRMVEEINTLAEPPADKTETEEKEPTISDLTDELIERFGKDCKLSTISVQEFMHVVMTHNLMGKPDKEE